MFALLLTRLTTYRWIAIGAVMALLVLSWGVQTKRLAWANAETIEVTRAWAADRAQATAAALAQASAYRAEEARRIAAHQEIVDEADRKTLAARADAAIADAAAGRLQQRIATLVAQARASAGNPGATPPGATTDDPGVLLADVFRRIDARAGELAQFADLAGAAGQACERAYTSLKEDK
jgi:hypothetical protein